jgi:4-hydroxy-tetrahydrodipicolinate synthase
MAPFEGLWPVMLTAFADDGAVDEAGIDALVDFYIDSGSKGLFAVCQSSEMLDLSDDERLRVARRVVSRTAGRVPVVAAGTFAREIPKVVDFVRRMADTGVDAVVTLPNQLTDETEDESVLRARLEGLAETTDPVPLGLYECPIPYHRTVSADLVAWAAASGRFRYMKDTIRDPAKMAPKLAAADGSELCVFNAAASSALSSLQLGAAGVSPVAANCYPELFAWLCDNASHEKAPWLQRRLTLMDSVVKLKYPQSAKRYLAALGLPVGMGTRVGEHSWDGYDDLIQDALRSTVAEVRAELGIG